MKLEQSSEEAETPDRRVIRMTLEYDGTRYAGWQRQLNSVSVQQVVEEALERHLGERIRVTASGRTDAGVHALGQVISFTTASRIPARAIQRGILAYLPHDVTARTAADAPPNFNARKMARMRWYRFFLSNRGVRPAVGSRYLTHATGKLNFGRMEEAAKALEGAHDFSAFRASTCNALRTRLTMQPVAVTALPDDLILLDFRCQSFLQNMVRILAGSIVACGGGILSVEDIQTMLRTGQRRNEARTLKPNGLFLYRVYYDGEDFERDYNI